MLAKRPVVEKSAAINKLPNEAMPRKSKKGLVFSQLTQTCLRSHTHAENTGMHKHPPVVLLKHVASIDVSPTLFPNPAARARDVEEAAY